MSDPLPPDLPNPWQRVHRGVGYQNPWITVYHDAVIRPDGQPGIYGVVHFKNIAVGIVAVDELDRVALVGQYRYTLDQYSWEIPEGGCPEGEDPLAAAQRELLEETGVTAKHWQELGRFHLSNSVSDELAIAYLATGLTHGTAQPEGTERLSLEWVPMAEVEKLIDGGRITDALTVLGVRSTTHQPEAQAKVV
jgi:8-oxo-dGTP pyrophosphatase MutT (NUDIX family)